MSPVYLETDGLQRRPADVVFGAELSQAADGPENGQTELAQPAAWLQLTVLPMV